MGLPCFPLFSDRLRRRVMQRIRTGALVSLAVLAGCSLARSNGRVERSQHSLDQLDEREVSGLRDARYGEGTIPRAEGEGVFRDIFFELDSAELTREAQDAIEANVEVLRDSVTAITLEGHCDEQGTAEYNLALAQRRAEAVSSYLSSLGIASSRLSVISYGENIPLDPRSTEEAWAKNRRVHFGLGSLDEVSSAQRGDPRADISPATPPTRQSRPRRFIPLEEGAIDSGTER